MYTFLALVSAVMGGAWSFGLGLYRGRISANSIVLVSAVAAAVVYFVVGVATGDLVVDSDDVPFGLVGGALNVSGTVLMVKAFERGKLGVVAGVVAMAALVPLAYSLVIGEPLQRTGAVGIVLTLVGLVIFLRAQGQAADAAESGGADQSVRSVVNPESGATTEAGLMTVQAKRDGSTTAILLAAGTALLWGTAIIILDVGSRVSLSGTLLMSQVPQVLALSIALAVSRGLGGMRLRPGVVIAVAGLALGVSNLTFYAAANMGDIGVVSVIGSLSPIVTALLALLFMRERMSRSEVVALGVVVVGTCLVVL